MIPEEVLLTWGATYKQLSPGEIIFTEGSQCNFYYQIVSGEVKWYNINDEGRACIQMLLTNNECFGELPLFDDGPYAASAAAETNVTLLRLHKNTFRKLLTDDAQLSLKFSVLLAQRLRYKFLMHKEMACHEPEKRINALLSYLRNNKKNICCSCNQIKLTRQQIADLTGLRVETVIRCMRNMHERGDIFIERGKVYLTNPYLLPTSITAASTTCNFKIVQSRQVLV